MNAVPNGWRQVPFAEIENDHAFRVFRHFPELRKSVPALKTLQLEKGRNWKDLQQPKNEMPREILHKSTHKLDELKKPATMDASLLSDFRKVLFEGRSKRMQSLSLVQMDEPLPTHHRKSPTNLPRSRAGTADGDQSVGSASTIACLRSANEKLTKLSVSYDSRDPVSYLLGFEGLALDKQELNVQLRRCLNIWLTKEELDALFESMDSDNSNLIDGVEFVRYFFSLGNKARGKINRELSNKLKKLSQEAKLLEVEKLEKLKKWESEQIAHSTAEESEHAMEKLAYAALRCDPSGFISHIKLQGFEKYLSPFEFKQQLEKSFDIRLTPGEVSKRSNFFFFFTFFFCIDYCCWFIIIIKSGALLKKYSTLPGEYCVDGHLFLCQFYVFQQEAWKKHKREMEVYAKRKERVNAMGQRMDTMLPKYLGR